MKVKSFLKIVFVAFFVSFALNSCSTNSVEQPVQPVSSIKTVNYTYSASELETLNLINVQRVNAGLKPLEQINYASYKSEEHDNYMIANNVVNHNNFVARSEDIMKAVGAKMVSENIAFDYNTPQATLTAWLNSPLHRENIFGNFTHFGISIRENAQGKKYYTNIFVRI